MSECLISQKNLKSHMLMTMLQSHLPLSETYLITNCSILFKFDLDFQVDEKTEFKYASTNFVAVSCCNICSPSNCFKLYKKNVKAPKLEKYQKLHFKIKAKLLFKLQ